MKKIFIFYSKYLVIAFIMGAFLGFQGCKKEDNSEKKSNSQKTASREDKATKKEPIKKLSPEELEKKSLRQNLLVNDYLNMKRREVLNYGVSIRDDRKEEVKKILIKHDVIEYWLKSKGCNGVTKESISNCFSQDRWVEKYSNLFKKARKKAYAEWYSEKNIRVHEPGDIKKNESMAAEIIIETIVKKALKTQNFTLNPGKLGELKNLVISSELARDYLFMTRCDTQKT